MLTPRASSAFVCLRCELTLARPRLPLLLRRPTPRASFSTSNRRRDAFEDEVQKEPSRPKLSEHPLGRVRRRKGGRAVRETTAHLEGTKTLGEDASIIVLEELGGGRKEEVKPKAEIVQEEDDEIPLNLADAIADEKPATLEEVVEQLDRLRQTATKGHANLDEENFVRQAVFVRLSAHLLRAFTSSQLSHYYSVKKNVGQDRVAEQVMEGVKELQGKAKRPAERSEWTPGTTQIDRRLPGLDVHRATKRRAIRKHLLVDQILRDVWKLQMLEELEAAGELELVLKDWQLALLTAGADETPLDRIGKVRRAKLEISGADRVLRITADKHTAEYAADDVQLLLQASESRRFHLKPWIPHLETEKNDKLIIADVFSPELLRSVSTLSGAYLQPSTHQIIIRALDKAAVSEAERCLIKLMPLRDPERHTLERTGVLTTPDHFVSVTVEKEALDYKLRDTRLGRWSHPIGQNNDTLPKSDSVIERLKRTQEHLVETFSPLLQQSRPPLRNHYWADRPDTKMEAEFGHLLFQSGNAMTEKPHFFPALPGMSSLFNDESFKVRFTTRASLWYDFVACPSQENYPTDRLPYQFPRLSVLIRPDNEGRNRMQKVVLQLEEAKHQVLLPEEAVDISFNSYQTVRLNNASTNPMMQSFMDEVLQNLQRGGRLSAPDVYLEIPRWTVKGMKEDGRKEMAKVKYILTGINVSQSVEWAHQNNMGTYVTRQTGKLGAKTGVFAMAYGTDISLTSDAIPTDPPNAIRQFVADTFKMASRITEAAATSQAGLKKIVRRPKTKKTKKFAAQTATEFEDTTSQTLDNGDAAPSPSQLDEVDALSHVEADALGHVKEDVDIDQSTVNNAETTSQSEAENETLNDTKTPERFIDDPYMSSMLSDAAPFEDHNEASQSNQNEESPEEEKKGRLAASSA